MALAFINRYSFEVTLLRQADRFAPGFTWRAQRTCLSLRYLLALVALTSEAAAERALTGTAIKSISTRDAP
jgi:hypothetical protein